eukprot:m.31365 g.31365  ORF g.31365 m.31365 type:complete len:458 (+) comp9414_c0_seq3:456-1829(+)
MKSKAVAIIVAIVALIVLVAVLISQSFVKVEENEICEVFFKNGITAEKRLSTKTTNGLYFVGPGVTKSCLNRTTEHLQFVGYEGLYQSVSSRSAEGVPIDLEIDIEYQFTPSDLEVTVLRVGFGESVRDRLARVARAEVRDAAGSFNTTAFLRGSRETISTTIQTNLQDRYDQDGIGVNVIRASILHISVHAQFETRFNDIESIKLDQRVAEENGNLAIVEQRRLNETGVIALLAQRDRELQEARAEVIAAELGQERSVTDAQTQAIRSLIQAESDRVKRTVQAETRLDELKANQALEVREAEREALAKFELAKTQRENLIAMSEGRLLRAAANRTRDIQVAMTQVTQRTERLVSVAINQTLQLFEIALNANTTAQKIEAEGDVNARRIYAEQRPATERLNLLKEKLGLSARELAQIIWYEAVGTSVDKTVLVDYEKQPLLNYERTGDSSDAVIVQT